MIEEPPSRMARSSADNGGCGRSIGTASPDFDAVLMIDANCVSLDDPSAGQGQGGQVAWWEELSALRQVTVAPILQLAADGA
jgi:hypothetical protein